MRITAILAVCNERPYLGNCLSHLIDNGLDYFVIDNGSEDGTRELLQEVPFADRLAGYSYVPYPGFFDWSGLLRAREAAAQTLDSDWIVFVSADEILHSNTGGETLAEAIRRVDALGDQVINFDEFVFLPVDHDYVPDRPEGQPLEFYYFFQPYRPRLMRARRRELAVSNLGHGGHLFEGEPFRLHPESFALRHYIFRDQAHARRKYPERVFSADEVSKGWHHNRAAKPAAGFAFPPLEELQRVTPASSRNLRRDAPRPRHYWEW